VGFSNAALKRLFNFHKRVEPSPPSDRTILRTSRARSKIWDAITWILAALALSGCASQGEWWDDYASRTETMKMFTFVPCDTDVKAIPQHQTYYHAWNLGLLSWGAYTVDYHVAKDRWVKTEVYFSSIWYLGLQHYTAHTAMRPREPKIATCAALVVLPWTEKMGSPFFISSAPAQLGNEAGGKLTKSGLAAAAAWISLLILFLLWAADGFAEG
jgi:hypothetical protein